MPETTVRKCDLCDKAVGKTYVDGKVKGMSSWATMCERCHAIVGLGIGTGLGQRYDSETGRKIAG